MDLSSKTLPDLRAMCKEKKLKGYSTLKKDQLIALLTPNAAETAESTETVHSTLPSAPTFIEVCAGCGGLSSGFLKAGFKALLLNEIQTTFCKTLRKNHPGVKVQEGSMLILLLNLTRAL